MTLAERYARIRQRARENPADRMTLIGMIFQMPMIALWLVLIWGWGADQPTWAHLLALPGDLLFGYCLVMLYVFKGRVKGLITTGPFRYTRHPMYLGMFIVTLMLWMPPQTDPWFYVVYTVWLGLICAAGYCQELETLERFGGEARAYYAVTPRFLPVTITWNGHPIAW